METATQALHRLTSYAPEREWTDPADDPRVVQDLEVNDLSRLPWWHKRYRPGLPVVRLPRELPVTSAPAVAVLAGLDVTVGAAELDLAGLARLLFLSAGVVRTGERAGRVVPFRAAGSAGGRFPLELYVAVPAGGALPPGVHWYDPAEHALVTVGPPPVGRGPALVVTGVPWRTGWRYRERGYRHVYWDAGTLLSQLLAAADSAGLAAGLHVRFPDDEVTALVGADGVHEWPVAVVGLGPGVPDLVASVTAVPGEVDAAPLEFPLVTAAQRAGRADGWGAAWERGDPVPAAAGADPVEQVVLRRGSQRRMDPAGRLPRGLLETSLAAALRGVDLPHRVVVSGVTDVVPGLYRWPDLSTPARAGDLRDETYEVCLEQGLGHDAAFVVLGCATVSQLSDHSYRAAQLAAGLVEGRLHLMAYASGASASGMTFSDALVAPFLGEPLDALLLTCVGVPEYASRPGGLPGVPTAVRTVLPR